MKKTIAIVLLLITGSTINAQEIAGTYCHGKVSSNSVSHTEGIIVVNQRTEKYDLTDHDGYFGLVVKEGDTLVFSSSQFQPLKKAITSAELEQKIMYVQINPVVNQLNEVVITQYPHINAVALGIIPAGQKSYSPAERRLKAGTKGFLAVDPLLNAISGRAAMLKRDLETEKKENWLEYVAELYGVDFFVSQLKIPLEYVKGFQYYMAEDQKARQVISSGKNPTSAFLMTDMATRYKEMNCL